MCMCMWRGEATNLHLWVVHLILNALWNVKVLNDVHVANFCFNEFILSLFWQNIMEYLIKNIYYIYAVRELNIFIK